MCCGASDTRSIEHTHSHTGQLTLQPFCWCCHPLFACILHAALAHSLSAEHLCTAPTQHIVLFSFLLTVYQRQLAQLSLLSSSPESTHEHTALNSTLHRHHPIPHKTFHISSKLPFLVLLLFFICDEINTATAFQSPTSLMQQSISLDYPPSKGSHQLTNKKTTDYYRG